jgi:hypothetical protein
MKAPAALAPPGRVVGDLHEAEWPEAATVDEGATSDAVDPDELQQAAGRPSTHLLPASEHVARVLALTTEPNEIETDASSPLSPRSAPTMP